MRQSSLISPSTFLRRRRGVLLCGVGVDDPFAVLDNDAGDQPGDAGYLAGGPVRAAVGADPAGIAAYLKRLHMS